MAPVPSTEAVMTTPRLYALVSRPAITILTLALAACAGGPGRAGLEAPSPTAVETQAIRFDNQARDRVHVYLVAARREWLLGRVEPGATATLKIPDGAFASEPGFMQLAVVAGPLSTQLASRNPRAQLTIAQDPAGIVSRQWRYAGGELGSRGLRTAH